MTGFDALWLPILLASVIVFVASSIINMAPLWHRSDYPRLAKEDAVIAALRPLDLPPGDYMVPKASSMKEMGTPEFMEKMNKGPVLVLTVMPNGQWSMAQNLVLWFVYCIVVSIFAAYVAGRLCRLGPTTSRSSASPVSRHSSRTRWPSGRCPSGTSEPGARPSKAPSTGSSTPC